MGPALMLSNVLMRLALRGVPRHLRASVHGDLLEQRAGPRDALAIALQFQAEPYRAGGDRLAALLLLICAATVLATVPLVSQGLLLQATAVFEGSFTPAMLLPWRAPLLLAAVACGLLVGRASLLPPHADAVRLHLVLLLTPAAVLAAPDALQAALAAGLLPAAAWLGFQNRLGPVDRPADEPG